MPSPHLRVTQRCLEEDLGLSEKDAAKFRDRDARTFRDRHEALDRFVEMRADEPAKGKAIDQVKPRGRVRSLRVGAGRAVTTWDPEEDVCWLLAYHWFHQSGHKDDCYNIFVELHLNGSRLLPSGTDYEVFLDSIDEEDGTDLGVVSVSLIDELEAVSAELLEEARAKPNVEAVCTFRVNGRQVMCVDMLVEPDGFAEEGWMSLKLPEDEYLSDRDVYELLASLLPDEVVPIYETRFRDRERMPGEIVYRWDFYG